MCGVGLFNEVNVYLPPKKYRAKIALVYPSTYEASITNLFMHTSYYYLANNSDVVIDRFTLDNPTEGAVTGLRLDKFDIILASISFELDVVELIRILVSNNIKVPLDDTSRRPLIIVGGLPATANPLPYTYVADAVFIGEGEVLLKLIREILDEYGEDVRIKREDVVNELLERCNCIYSKHLHKYYANIKLRKALHEDFSKTYGPECLIRSMERKPVYGDGYYIEVSRGCKWLCPYCLEAYTTHPPRYKDYNVIIRSVRDGMKCLKVNRVVFISLSFFDHPKADEILKDLISNGIKFSIPSLRYTTLNEERVDLIALGGQRTLTIAPETAIQKVSCLIGKCLNTLMLERIVKYALGKGLNIKFYFMLGLPGEGQGAGKEIAKLVNNLIKESKLTRREQVRITVNPLIPKPNTPTQYLPLIRRKEFEEKVRDLRRGINKALVRVNVYEWSLAYTQALIALGTEEVGKLLIDAVVEGKGLAGFRKIAKSRGLDRYVREVKEVSSELPWEFIDLGLSSIIKAMGSKLLDQYLSST